MHGSGPVQNVSSASWESSAAESIAITEARPSPPVGSTSGRPAPRSKTPSVDSGSATSPRTSAGRSADPPSAPSPPAAGGCPIASDADSPASPSDSGPAGPFPPDSCSATSAAGRSAIAMRGDRARAGLRSLERSSTSSFASPRPASTLPETSTIWFMETSSASDFHSRWKTTSSIVPCRSSSVMNPISSPLRVR